MTIRPIVRQALVAIRNGLRDDDYEACAKAIRDVEWNAGPVARREFRSYHQDIRQAMYLTFGRDHRPDRPVPPPRRRRRVRRNGRRTCEALSATDRENGRADVQQTIDLFDPLPSYRDTGGRSGGRSEVS